MTLSQYIDLLYFLNYAEGYTVCRKLQMKLAAE